MGCSSSHEEIDTTRNTMSTKTRDGAVHVSGETDTKDDGTTLCPIEEAILKDIGKWHKRGCRGKLRLDLLLPFAEDIEQRLKSSSPMSRLIVLLLFAVYVKECANDGSAYSNSMEQGADPTSAKELVDGASEQVLRKTLASQALSRASAPIKDPCHFVRGYHEFRRAALDFFDFMRSIPKNYCSDKEKKDFLAMVFKDPRVEMQRRKNVWDVYEKVTGILGSIFRSYIDANKYDCTREDRKSRLPLLVLRDFWQFWSVVPLFSDGPAVELVTFHAFIPAHQPYLHYLKQHGMPFDTNFRFLFILLMLCQQMDAKISASTSSSAEAPDVISQEPPSDGHCANAERDETKKVTGLKKLQLQPGIYEVPTYVQPLPNRDESAAVNSNMTGSESKTLFVEENVVIEGTGPMNIVLDEKVKELTFRGSHDTKIDFGKSKLRICRINGGEQAKTVLVGWQEALADCDDPMLENVEFSQIPPYVVSMNCKTLSFGKTTPLLINPLIFSFPRVETVLWNLRGWEDGEITNMCELLILSLKLHKITLTNGSHTQCQLVDKVCRLYCVEREDVVNI